MTTEAVIECVKEYPILYDVTRPDYKDKKENDKIWDEIGEKFSVMPPVPTDLLHQMAVTCSQEQRRAVTTVSWRGTIPPCRCEEDTCTASVTVPLPLPRTALARVHRKKTSFHLAPHGSNCAYIPVPSIDHIWNYHTSCQLLHEVHFAVCGVASITDRRAT
jgi:hypothetical protein